MGLLGFFRRNNDLEGTDLLFPSLGLVVGMGAPKTQPKLSLLIVTWQCRC